MFEVNKKDARKTSLRSFWCLHLLTLNYFTSFPSFPIADFAHVNNCWEIYLTFFLFDICFNVTTGGTQDLTRSSTGNSDIFLVSQTQ